MSSLRSMVGLAALLAGAAAPADAPLLFQAEAQVLAGRCAGNDLRIEGNHNSITVAGQCRSVLLKGVANNVSVPVAGGAAIRVEGSGNRVRYATPGEGPAIEILGPDNDVVAGAPPPLPAPAAPAPPPPAPAARPAAAAVPKPVTVASAPAGSLVLAGDDQTRAADCAGRDVTVTGKRGAYVLRGGCRSLTLRGDLLTVQAEMQPGARIAIEGVGDVVTWQLRGRGRNPASFVRGAGSRVQRALPG